MAATRLIALHKNKGKSVAACLKSRTDYVQNPDKTEHGELISSYECSPLTVDEEFMLSKRQYELVTGRRQKSDVIAYQIRQSFKPGEITAEEANKVGYELAMRFTKGKYAFIVATHTDREHIHNHIIYNSTALDSTRKFRDFLLSGLAVQRLSDLICLEHQLSVIEIKPYRERQKRTLYPPKESNRDRLCGVIDTILTEKPKDYEDFLQGLEQQGYEVKRGKYTSVKGARQKRFIRFRTLGAGYSEEELKAVISGEAEHHSRQKQKRIVPEQKFQMLVDIQAKLAEGKSMGYARWAKRYNLKEMSKTLIFLQENKIGSIEEMQERIDAATARYHELGDSIKAAETRILLLRHLHRERQHDAPGKLGVPLVLHGFHGVPKGCPVCISGRRMGRQHDLGVDKLFLLVVEFCFLVVLAEQPFAALISGPGNSGLPLAALDDGDFEMRTRNRHHPQTKRPPSKIALDERSNIKLYYSGIFNLSSCDSSSSDGKLS